MHTNGTTERRRAQLHEMLAGWGSYPTEDEMREMFEEQQARQSTASVFRQEGRGWVGDEELRRAA